MCWEVVMGCGASPTVGWSWSRAGTIIPEGNQGIKIENIPSDGQIRNLLDPIDPSLLREPFWDIYDRLQAHSHPDSHCHVGGTLLCSMDGTRYFSSENIHCGNCTVYEHEDRTYCAHMVVAAVLSVPGKKHVLGLAPEFIVPQEGHDKQDCERQAIKRWVTRNAERFGEWEVTVLTDDLHSHQPLCEMLLENKFHFTMTCKPTSYSTLYEEVELLAKVEGTHQTKTVRRWTGRRHGQWTYRWVLHLLLKTGPNALRVNWCEVMVLREDTGKQAYHSAWITSHELTAESVEAVVDASRNRWKIENGGFNVLKNQGYDFEHNFGRDQQDLAAGH